MSGASCSSFLAFFISSNFSPVPSFFSPFKPLLLFYLLYLLPFLLTTPSFLSFLNFFLSLWRRALPGAALFSNTGRLRHVAGLPTPVHHPLLPCCPSFSRAGRTFVRGTSLSASPAAAGGGPCARSGATLMRSYLPAFAKTARVHRYCAALNGGTRCAVSAAYRCCPSFLDSGSTAVVGLGPHRVEHTPSRPIWTVKQRRARLVLAWVTGWESRVSKPPGIAHFAFLPLLFFFRPLFFARS